MIAPAAHIPIALSVRQVIDIRRRRARGESLRTIALVYGISDSYVSKLCLGKRASTCEGPITRARAYSSRPNQDDPARSDLTPLDDIARFLGVSRGTVYNDHLSALRKLRAALVSMEAWQ